MVATKYRRRTVTFIFLGLCLGLLIYFASKAFSFFHEVGCGFLYVCSDPVRIVDGRATATMASINFEFEARFVFAASEAWNKPQEYSAFWLQLPIGPGGSPSDGATPSKLDPSGVIKVLLTSYPMDEGGLMRISLKDWKGREGAPIGSTYHESDRTKLSSVYLREQRPDLQMDALVLQNPSDDNPLEHEYFVEFSSGRVLTTIKCIREQPPMSSFKSGCELTRNIFGSLWYKAIFDRQLLVRWREIDATVQKFLRSSLARESAPS